MSNTVELPRHSFKPKPLNFKEDSRGGTFYRIKKTNMDKLRKDKKKRRFEGQVGLEKGSEETMSINAKQIGKPAQVVQKNIDIHIGNVNTYNIYLNGEQKQSIVQTQTSKMSRGMSPPDSSNGAVSEMKKNRKPLRNVPTVPNINGKQIGQRQGQPYQQATLSEPKSSFKIAKVKRNNLIPKDDPTEEVTIPSILPRPPVSKYKSYQPDNRKVRKILDDDLAAGIRQPSPLDSKIRGVAARFKKL